MPWQGFNKSFPSRKETSWLLISISPKDGVEAINIFNIYCIFWCIQLFLLIIMDGIVIMVEILIFLSKILLSLPASLDQRNVGLVIVQLCGVIMNHIINTINIIYDILYALCLDCGNNWLNIKSQRLYIVIEYIWK